jgi:hypothetical protein
VRELAGPAGGADRRQGLVGEHRGVAVGAVDV